MERLGFKRDKYTCRCYGDKSRENIISIHIVLESGESVNDIAKEYELVELLFIKYCKDEIHFVV